MGIWDQDRIQSIARASLKKEGVSAILLILVSLSWFGKLFFGLVTFILVSLQSILSGWLRTSFSLS